MQLPGPVRARLQQQYAERMRDLNEIYLQVGPQHPDTSSLNTMCRITLIDTLAAVYRAHAGPQ